MKADSQDTSEPKQPGATKSLTGVWTRKNVFNPDTIKKSRITLWERVRLLFHRSYRSFDSGKDVSTVVRYKRMNDKIYALKVTHIKHSRGTDLLAPDHTPSTGPKEAQS